MEFHPGLVAVYALSIYGAMLMMATVLLRLGAVQSTITVGSGRYGCVDGLRGVLAIFVMVHHSFTCYHYFTTGVWQWSTSALLNQLGQSSVALFFMITGFLFALKASSPDVKWKALYTSRLARLGPLYALVVLSVFVTVFVLSDGALKETVPQILSEFLQWITFVFFDRPDVNGYPMTWTLIAGVNWSLKWEVRFYIAVVPALYVAARFISLRARLVSAVIALMALLVFRWRTVHYIGEQENALYGAQFLGGIIVAYAYQVPAIHQALSSSMYRVLAAVALALLVSLNDVIGATAVMCATVIFGAIVGGASLGGILRTRAAIWLGDVSYGIYLMHGFMLWLLMSALKTGSPHLDVPLSLYWPLIVGVGIVVVSMASLSYVALERPIMRLVTFRERPATALSADRRVAAVGS